MHVYSSVYLYCPFVCIEYSAVNLNCMQVRLSILYASPFIVFVLQSDCRTVYATPHILIDGFEYNAFFSVIFHKRIFSASLFCTEKSLASIVATLSYIALESTLLHKKRARAYFYALALNRSLRPEKTQKRATLFRRCSFSALLLVLLDQHVNTTRIITRVQRYFSQTKSIK